MTLAQEAGFDVSKEDWLKHQAQTNLELSDKELEVVAGGVNANPFYTMVPNECNKTNDETYECIPFTHPFRMGCLPGE